MKEEQPQPEVEVISPSSLELIQRAEIDLQISTAKKYPRDLARVKSKMISFATLDEETAESCFYTLPRDGKTIQGPTVRLAEIAVACYTNLRAASRIISNDGRVITSQAACHDLENNTLISVEVQRRITTKQGKTYSEEMQVTAGNAANAIAFRNAVFKVVPGALIRPVYEAAKAVAVGNASTLSSKRDKMVKRLNAMQVPTIRILSRLGKSSVENIDLADLEVLIGLGTAIRDGDTTVDEAFPENAHDERLDRKMADQAREAEGAGKPEPAAATPSAAAAAAPPSSGEEVPAIDIAPGAQWRTLEGMEKAYKAMMEELGSDAFFAVLGTNGMTQADMQLSNPGTVSCYRALKAAAAEKTKSAPPEEKANPKPVFGRRPNAAAGR